MSLDIVKPENAPQVGVIIPLHNEEKTLRGIVERIKQLNFEKRIILVDDYSNDKSFEIASFIDGVTLLRHKMNLGKGAALKTGCEFLLKAKRIPEIIVFLDSDGQHSPEDIPKLVSKLKKENLEIAFGERSLDRKKMPFVKFLGNKALGKIISFLSRVAVQDTQTGFKAFLTKVYPKILWRASDYSVDTEIIFNTGKNKLKYGTVLIQTFYQDTYKGTTVFDGIKIFLNCLKYKFF